ncbi:unnamed protein product [Amoebophrya sp. A25]|nr:unnamed protein product [Amoebophrya sp. A25]|eukprot:GSA25T00027156001.1
MSERSCQHEDRDDQKSQHEVRAWLIEDRSSVSQSSIQSSRHRCKRAYSLKRERDEKEARISRLHLTSTSTIVQKG